MTIKHVRGGGDGARLRAAREKAGLTQTALGRMTQTSNGSLCRWEKATDLSGAVQARFAGVLEVVWAFPKNAPVAKMKRVRGKDMERDGVRLREARLAAGKTQEQLGEKLRVPQAFVSKWESRGYLTKATRQRFAGVLPVAWARTPHLSDRTPGDGKKERSRKDNGTWTKEAG